MLSSPKWMRPAIFGSMAAIAIGFAPAAFADKKTESFVEASANQVLQVLNNKSVSDVERATTFAGYMNKFASMDSIAQRVLGPKARELTPDQRARYLKAFQNYAVAVYQFRLDQFRGQSIKVTGSTDEGPRRYHVTTLIKSSQTGQDTRVIWDVLQSQDGASYRVRDVALEIKGSEIWLAQDQAKDFQRILEKNNGDIDKLVAAIDRMTADLKSGKSTD
jgi:phospholipid transport system substrate-binding protein